jgi:hypothetical protein
MSTILAAGNPHSLKPAIAVFTVIICLQINIYKTEKKANIGFILIKKPSFLQVNRKLAISINTL